MTEWAIVVPWVYDEEIAAFLRYWRITTPPDWLILQQDKQRDGCGVTKNKGVRRAVAEGAEVVVVLDGDCYPTAEAPTLPQLAEKHLAALKPQPVSLYETVTDPPSRGTPYSQLSVEYPVAASMGFWLEVGDYGAVRQLAYQGAPMEFRRKTVYGRYFSLCGMNLAFRPGQWYPWCEFVDVARFDDIWMGWLWQREAYRRGYCFNLAGPLVRHARQSNVWSNLTAEARYLEQSEILWSKIATHPDGDYAALYDLLPTERCDCE
jgi:hypothetical protein